MRRLLSIVAFASFANLASLALAINLSFMPGDAFFSTRVTADVADNLPVDGGRLKFEYAIPQVPEIFADLPALRGSRSSMQNTTS